MSVGVIDFFSGAGGTSLGLQRAGMTVLGGVDDDLDSAATFRHNFPNAGFVRGDIRCLGVEHVLSELRLDASHLLLSACAPCQPFTTQRTDRPSEDARAPLLLELTRFIQGLRPSLLLVENVPGMQRMPEDSSPLSDFLRAIDSEGYKSTVSFVQAREYGVPQRRGRLIVLASRLGVPGFPEPTHGIGRLPYSTVRDWIADLPPIAAGETHPTVKNHQAAALSELNMKRIRATPEGGDRLDWPAELWLECHSGGYDGHTDVYGRMMWESPATGLTTRCISYSNGRFGHPKQDRAISAREAASLQTFPEDFEFMGSLTSQARQIGNAVPILLAESVGRHLLAHLNRAVDTAMRQQPAAA